MIARAPGWPPNSSSPSAPIVLSCFETSFSMLSGVTTPSTSFSRSTLAGVRRSSIVVKPLAVGILIILADPAVGRDFTWAAALPQYSEALPSPRESKLYA